MTISNIKNIVEDLIAHEHEEEWFEFKVNWNEPHALGEYISALSNVAALEGREYGYFVWGIENNTHNIIGTAFDFHQDVRGNEPLKHYLARQTNPDIGFDFYEIILQGKRLVVLVIPAAKKVPTAFDDVRYTRIGSSKEKLMKYPEHESQLFYILRHGVPTIENTESQNQDLSFGKLFVYYEAKGLKLNKRTFKKNLGFLTDNGKYNILAQLLSDDSHIPIRFALFHGTNKASAMYSVREFGNTCLLYSLDKILEYGDVLNIPQADERNRIVVRKEVPLFNNEVYREAVINAFVHNRWIDGNAPMFTGFQNRIEILSRGNLPPKQTLEGFYAGESVPVNQALSRIFIQLHITEHTGRGVPKITEVYGRENIRFNENSIVVTIPYDRLGEEIYVSDDIKSMQLTTIDRIPPVGNEIPPVRDGIPPVGDEIPPVRDGIPPVGKENLSDEILTGMGVEDKILLFCVEPKGILEIAGFLGYKDKKTVRKYLRPLIEQGRIARTIPDSPSSRFQKYITIK